MVNPEDIRIQKEGKQFITPLSERKKLQQLNQDTQNKFIEANKYKKFDNTPEEKISEVYIYQFLKENLPECQVTFGSISISRFDIYILFPSGKNIQIEVKTKSEDADWYVYRFEENAVDKTASIPNNKIGQIFDSDYTIWTMTSKFGELSSQYTDSSSSVTLITRGDELTKDDFTYVDNKNPYYYIDLSKRKFELLGSESLDTLVKELREKYL
ncbi:MAG: hypothetical protein ACP5OA_07260 [Candidatus Woesearchaeota archaeon]